ncbi:hypothetical protein ASE75_07530 [Sphingomonas sp. Leaf17]|uniref:hypothetical protein n=1 Tax=Sphingomonas sp. Leaf17 TaxID=1735683 RepID=UPI0006FDD724|nr:hypothetical protein [Sphingomonas sp. Leaf17]KQM64916.1 hypothetical protein ASE75_07530 [Sphingomonas sp. Leaf17]
MRPKSIVQGEYLYLASIVLLLVLAILGWDDAVAQSGATVAIGVNAFFIGLSLLLLILTTRRASRVALWLLVVLTTINAGGYLLQVASGVLANGLFGILTTAQAILGIVACQLFFRTTAREWFAERRYMGDVDTEFDA